MRKDGSLGRGGQPAAIATAHLDRALRSRGYDSDLSYTLSIPTGPPNEGGQYWSKGLLKGLQRSDLLIYKGGAPLNTADASTNPEHERNGRGL